jgi:uncharacterized MAPEG superfamily protein
MTMEIKWLAWSIGLGIAYVLLTATLSIVQRGLVWGFSNRDGDVKALIGPAARAHRATVNFLETFPFFAAAVLAVVFTKESSPHTLLGAQIYFWARLVYLPVYFVGIPYLRTLVWAASLWGLLMVLEPLW